LIGWRAIEVEAEAPDGAIEAVSMDEAPGFLLGSAMAPRMAICGKPVSRAIFTAFGDALRLAPAIEWAGYAASVTA
jgi:putative glutamine amidotransferase